MPRTHTRLFHNHRLSRCFFHELRHGLVVLAAGCGQGGNDTLARIFGGESAPTLDSDPRSKPARIAEASRAFVRASLAAAE